MYRSFNLLFRSFHWALGLALVLPVAVSSVATADVPTATYAGTFKEKEKVRHCGHDRLVDDGLISLDGTAMTWSYTSTDGVDLSGTITDTSRNGKRLYLELYNASLNDYMTYIDYWGDALCDPVYIETSQDFDIKRLQMKVNKTGNRVKMKVRTFQNSVLSDGETRKTHHFLKGKGLITY